MGEHIPNHWKETGWLIDHAFVFNSNPNLHTYIHTHSYTFKRAMSIKKAIDQHKNKESQSQVLAMPTQTFCRKRLSPQPRGISNPQDKSVPPMEMGGSDCKWWTLLISVGKPFAL